MVGIKFTSHYNTCKCAHVQVDVEGVVQAISNLPVPSDWVDPVTQVNSGLC